MSEVDTFFLPSSRISAVLKPSFNTSLIADSNNSDSLSKFSDYFKAIAKLNIIAIGLAIPFPAISGADP